MRTHVTYANITATLALVFAMTGGAVAAKHYLVNSSSQINPKVLKKLKGHAGAPGKNGAPGKEGSAGREGSTGKEGPAGPVSVTRMDFFEPTSATPNESDTFEFLGQTVTEHFNDAKTAADVSASVDIGSSNGKPLELSLGICVMAVGGTEALPVAQVRPELTEPEGSFLAQTVTGVVTGLSAGSYVIGACTASETANVAHGDAAGSVLLAQTAEGGSTGVAALRAARTAQATGARR